LAAWTPLKDEKDEKRSSSTRKVKKKLGSKTKKSE
jgi:hypothetical protein